MTVDSYAARAIEAMQEKRSSLVTTVLSGQAGGDRYYALTGEIRGLERAMQILRDLVAPTVERGHPLREPTPNERPQHVRGRDGRRPTSV